MCRYSVSAAIIRVLAMAFTDRSRGPGLFACLRKALLEGLQAERRLTGSSRRFRASYIVSAS
jgi:hypothetical protein